MPTKDNVDYGCGMLSEEIEHKGVAYDTWLHATRGLESGPSLAYSFHFHGENLAWICEKSDQGNFGPVSAGRIYRRTRALGSVSLMRSSAQRYCAESSGPGCSFSSPVFTLGTLMTATSFNWLESKYEAAIMDSETNRLEASGIQQARSTGPPEEGCLNQ